MTKLTPPCIPKVYCKSIFYPVLTGFELTMTQQTKIDEYRCLFFKLNNHGGVLLDCESASHTMLCIATSHNGRMNTTRVQRGCSVLESLCWARRSNGGGLFFLERALLKRKYYFLCLNPIQNLRCATWKQLQCKHRRRWSIVLKVKEGTFQYCIYLKSLTFKSNEGEKIYMCNSTQFACVCEHFILSLFPKL